MSIKTETTGQRIVRLWLESEHGDEDVDDDGGTIRDWFEYADVSRQDLEQRITANDDHLRDALRRALEMARLHFPENDMFTKRMANIIEPILEQFA